MRAWPPHGSARWDAAPSTGFFQFRSIQRWCKPLSWSSVCSPCWATLGIAIAPLLTTLGLGGLAVALALNDTLTNLFAGIQIITAHQLRVGDYVRFDFAEGTVSDIQWHNTTIRDAQNNLVVVPNAKVNTSVFTNFSRGGHDLVVPVTASLPWKGTFEQLRELASGASDGAPVQMTALNETNVQVTAYLPAAAYAQRGKIAAQFLERLHDAAMAANMGAKPAS